ncbi:MAG: hypothetical protein LBU27_00375, partial [Candidatus Peribacteria bacterium]|nr:hypothetical protein [Candidatus Peribacteria bacterium]
ETGEYTYKIILVDEQETEVYAESSEATYEVLPAATATITVPSGTGIVGEEITINASLVGNETLSGKTVKALVVVTSGDTTKLTTVPNIDFNGGMTGTFGIFPINGESQPATLKVTFKETGEYTYKIILVDEQETEVYAESSEATYEVLPALVATITASNGTTTVNTPITITGSVQANSTLSGKEVKMVLHLLSGDASGVTSITGAAGEPWTLVNGSATGNAFTISDSVLPGNFSITIATAGTYEYQLAITNLDGNITYGTSTVYTITVNTSAVIGGNSGGGSSGGGSSGGGSSGGGSYYGGGSSSATIEETELQGEVSEEPTSAAKCSIEGSTYSDEENAAYLRACENDITTMRTIKSARLDDLLTRAEAAKLMSQYAINILGKQADTTKDCSNFQNSIESYKGSDLYNYMTTSCQLEIMGINPDRSVIPDFMGASFLERRDFGTVFSRLLRGAANENKGTNYWDGHLQALNEKGIITNLDASLLELRSRVFLQLYRSAQISAQK